MLPVPAFWAAAAGPSAVRWLWLHSSVRSAPFVTVGSVLEVGTDNREDVMMGGGSNKQDHGSEQVSLSDS